MIPGRIVRGKPYLHEMTAFDAVLCLEHANAVDPFRGPKWFAAFVAYAKLLGYHASELAVCHCPNAPHRPECGLIAPTRYNKAPMFPHWATDNPADGIIDTPTQYPFLPVYEDPDGMHRHQCPECQTVWEHSDNNAGSATAHTCPACGFYRSGWAFFSGQKSTYDPYDDHRAPDYSERFNTAPEMEHDHDVKPHRRNA